MTDQNFPLISYSKNESCKSWGRMHGESFREGIKELCAIRKNLLLSKNPHIAKSLEDDALKQFEVTKKYSQELADELAAIAEGANLTLSQIIILNNYTDLKDIGHMDEGCSSVHFQKFDKKEQQVCAGQTWDMHGSAKKYCALLKIPAKGDSPAMVMFTLVGCVGMMGINSNFLLTSINNINTKKAKNGVIWPVTVRQMLKQKSFQRMKETLLNTQVTSGHNYMLSDKNQGEHWEVTPHKFQKVCHLASKKSGVIFHTNHCLGDEIIPLEIKKNIISTSKIRYSLLEKKTGALGCFEDLKSLFKDHENYPHSLCLHSPKDDDNSQDPSITCGGGIANLIKGDLHFWRGCEKNDPHYRHYNFRWDCDSMDFKEV